MSNFVGLANGHKSSIQAEDLVSERNQILSSTGLGMLRDTNAGGRGRWSVETLCKIPFHCLSFLPRSKKIIQKKIKPKYMLLQIFIQKIKQSQTQYKKYAINVSF